MFWVAFFDVHSSESFFYCFLAAPGYPETMKIKQNPCSVARNQGLAKIENGTSGVDFGSRFGSHFDTFGRIFSDLSCFFAVCFSVDFLHALNVRTENAGSKQRTKQVPLDPLKDMRQHGVKSSKKAWESENASACTSACTVVDTHIYIYKTKTYIYIYICMSITYIYIYLLVVPSI